jgi:hypothetical protein
MPLHNPVSARLVQWQKRFMGQDIKLTRANSLEDIFGQCSIVTMRIILLKELAKDAL